MIRPRGVIRADVLETPRGTDWRDQGACLKEDPELFFTAGDGADMTAAKRAQINEAKAVCKPCPSKSECLVYALETRQVGVWGETDDEDRATLRRNASRSPAQCGTRSGRKRHYALGEPACEECREAARKYERTRIRDRRSA